MVANKDVRFADFNSYYNEVLEREKGPYSLLLEYQSSQRKRKPECEYWGREGKKSGLRRTCRCEI
jgi:hypothetical protein